MYRKYNFCVLQYFFCLPFKVSSQLYVQCTTLYSTHNRNTLCRSIISVVVHFYIMGTAYYGQTINIRT